MARYKVGYRLKPDEQTMQASQLEDALCRHELRVLLNGGWWCLLSASADMAARGTTQVELRVYMQNAVRKGKMNLFSISVPEDRLMLVKVRGNK